MQRVLVLGVPRSGTTWIGEALGRTVAATYVHEPDGVHDPFAFRARGDLPTGFILGPTDLSPQYERLWRGAFAGGAKSSSVRDRFARRCYAGVTTAQRAAVRRGERATVRLSIAAALAQPRVSVPEVGAVVVKSVDAAMTAEWIATRFEPTVLVVERDLRSVLASWLSLDMRGPQHRNYDALRQHARAVFDVELPEHAAPVIERATAVCALWALTLRSTARRLGWNVVRYEDIATQPDVTLRAIADRAGLVWSDDVDAFLASSNRAGSGYATQREIGSTIDAWKRALSEDQVMAIESVVARFPRELRDDA